jgi:hypothetical protein
LTLFISHYLLLFFTVGGSETPLQVMPVVNLNVGSDESWDDDVPTYDPMVKITNDSKLLV